MHELLAAAAVSRPVSGNAHGSYITMRSKNGLIFGVINVVGNFATVFQDQAYWQRAIASKPASTVKAYLLGGLAWCARESFSSLYCLISAQVCCPFRLRDYSWPSRCGPHGRPVYA